MQRNVYYYTHVTDAPAEVLRERFLGDPAAWLPEPAQLTANGWLVDLHADGVLVPPLSKHRAELQVAAPDSTGGVIVRRVSWHATQADRLFPVLSAELELAPLAAFGCSLSLSGSYRPPLSVVGGAADRHLGHRVAEACVRRFVLDLAERLTPATLMA